MPVSKKVNKDFFKKWTPQMAYVLGFFAADGYITVNKRGGEFWCIQITDYDLLISIKNAIGSNHKIGIRYSKNKNESTLYRLQIGSKEMCNDLRKLGYSERKTKSLSIFSIPNEFFHHFVRGYFDGDGNIWVGKIHKDRKNPLEIIQMAFTSCSHVFLKTLREKLCLLYGLGNGTLYSPKDGCYRLQYNKKDTLQLCNIMYNDIAFGSLYLKRKKDRFDKFKTMRT